MYISTTKQYFMFTPKTAKNFFNFHTLSVQKKETKKTNEQTAKNFKTTTIICCCYSFQPLNINFK